MADTIFQTLTDERDEREWPCDEPGPGDSHCTDRPGHDWSCYDARGDVSFNARQDWTHCHPGCPDDGHVSEYC